MPLIGLDNMQVALEKVLAFVAAHLPVNALATSGTII